LSLVGPLDSTRSGLPPSEVPPEQSLNAGFCKRYNKIIYDGRKSREQEKKKKQHKVALEVRRTVRLYLPSLLSSVFCDVGLLIERSGGWWNFIFEEMQRGSVVLVVETEEERREAEEAVAHLKEIYREKFTVEIEV